ncbi:hypothetical protein LTR56_002570 [Elasticomyces elasticus]|nr:hypothetical protein LTR22_013472 [Elasticomyces elasticus]KAK3657056.1 hypothetical protein LTR56_002570 [Elasticomyces elasticus]KAK4926715.1 hypothetical protein LTR49_006397 [Elasticomyces elasticus]KAK5762334.1 hypothetical protein LTS12_007493 [Elasticomyces elasticus]
MESLDRRITDAYPIELHYIKALYLQKQYRQCIQSCRDVLKAAAESIQQYPLQQTFISFYVALSHDELARLMHENSQSKLPAFRQAAQFYKEAIESLSSLEVDTAARKSSRSPSHDDPFTDSPSTTSRDLFQTPREHDYDPFNYATPSFPNLSSSPPAQLDFNNLPSRSPQTSSRETSSSDLDSHSSFDQIVTPHKILERDASLPRSMNRTALPKHLERDVSRMSLLDDTHKAPVISKFPRSTSQGLMKPIRLGSPPTAFHVPPRLPYSGSTASMSRLAKFNTARAKFSSPPRGLPVSISEEWSEPTPPVSPLTFDEAKSDGSTISPLSLETPVRGSKPHGHDDEESSSRSHLADHIVAMRAQLETHLHLLDQAMQGILTAQAKRAANRASTASSKGTPLKSDRTSASSYRTPMSSTSNRGSISSEGKRLPASRSYWSFTPVDVGAEELRKRVEEGRKRGWARTRFDREKYVVLAEKALAEL